MKIVLDTTGGFAGAVNRTPRVVATESFSNQDHREVTQLIKDLQHASMSRNTDPSRMRDSIVFTITCDDVGEKLVFQEHDFAMSEAFGKLMQWIVQHSSPASKEE